MKLINKKHESDLLAQIKHIEAGREAEKMEKVREFEEGIKEENRYQEKIKKVCKLMWRRLLCCCSILRHFLLGQPSFSNFRCTS